MKKILKRISAAAVTILVCASLSGCGILPEVTDLSDEQEEKIALYCARVVSKYNLNQDKGIVPLPEESDEDNSTEIPDQESSSESTGSTESAGTSSTSDSSSATSGSTENNINILNQNGTSSDSAGTSQTSSDAVTLTQAIGKKNVSFIYREAKASDSYQSGNVYDLSPDKGKELLVIRIKAENTGSKKVKLDFASSGISYSATVAGTTVNNDTTLIMNDLSTYQGTIKAGRSRNMVLIFQFPSGTLDDLSDLSLVVTRDGTDYPIDLALSENG